MKETYGIFKKFAADNHYSLLTKAVNSAFTTRDTASTMKKLSEENGHGFLEVWGHLPTFRRCSIGVFHMQKFF